MQNADYDNIPFDEPVVIEITDVLDLHTIPPRDVKRTLEAYLLEAHARSFAVVRIIHGKGIGQLRQTVHSILSKLPEVASFALASEHFGGWGATIVHLHPLNDSGGRD